MKSYKYLYTVLFSLSCLAGLLGQTNKKTLNYQAVILDPKAIDIPGASITGQPLNNGKVCLRFSLLNAQGGLDYEETQQVTTDEYGLVNVAIGTGMQAQSGNSTSIYKSFESVVWNSSVKSLKVSVSYDGCSSFKQVSSQAFNYTPYALYAEAVDYKNVREAPTKLSQFTNDAGYLIPKDLDPLKADIQTNSSKIEVANKLITDNKQASDAAFLVVNQSITSLDTKVAANTTAIQENTSSITNINTKLTDQQNQINDNRNQITATNNNLNTQIGGLQGQLNTTNSTVSNLSGAAEVVSNKSIATDLGGANPSDQLYPSQKAAKAYVDQSIYAAVGSGVPDATSLAAGKVQLSGDLGGTATSPTVPALAGKENTSNKSTNVQTDAASDTKYPSVKAVKAYVDQATMGTALQATVDGKADKASPIFTGTPVLPTGTTGVTQSASDNSTKLATTAFVQAATAGIALQASVDAKADKNSPTFTGTPVLPSGTIAVTQNSGDNSTNIATTAFVQQATAAGIIDASTSTKGKLKLSGDLGGTAEAPTVPGLALKANASDVNNSLALKEDASNKSNAALGTSTTLYPTQSAVKTYVDAQVASGAPDATSLVKGKIALSGDLAGTNSSASTPVISDNAITSDKIANLAVTDAKIAGVAGSKVLGNITGNAANVTGTVAVANGGTGSSTLTANNVLLGNGASALQVVAPGATGNVLTSNGTTWSSSAPQNSANTISGVVPVANGGTGLSSLTSGGAVYASSTSALTTGTLPITAGGTGAISANAAFNAIAPTQISNSGKYLTTDGTNTSWGTVASTLPTTVNTSTNYNIVMATGQNLALVTGTGNGGTAATLNPYTGQMNISGITAQGYGVTSPFYASAPQALTDAATISWNPLNGLNASVTLGGNRTLSFSAAPASGSYGTLVITQDGTGGRTLALPSGTNKVLGSTSTTTIALSTAANAKDILNFYFDGSTYFWNIGQGYGAAAATGVTSVAMTTPTGLSITGSPITSSGTLALSLTSGYAIPTTSSQTNWDAAYTNRITSASSPLSITSNALSLGTVPVANGGTGVTTFTSGSLLKGNGTSAISAASAGTDYSAGTSALGTGILKSTTTTGVLSIASAADFPTLNQSTTGNAATATKLATSRTINGTAFDGSSDITVTAAAGTLTGNTLSSSVLSSSLTSVGNLASLSVTTDITANGVTMGRGNLSRANNYAFGYLALASVSAASGGNGNYNNAFGHQALTANTTGQQNSAFGEYVLPKNIGGSSNTAMGISALRENTSGNYNTGFGNQSLLTNTTGSNNTAIGSQADVSSANLTNATAIGNGAKVATSNTIQLGNTAITNVSSTGTLTLRDVTNSIQVTYPNTHNATAGQVLTINAAGTASWATPSGGSSSGGHYVGEVYGGGIVFYVTTGGYHGLIASSTDLGGAPIILIDKATNPDYHTYTTNYENLYVDWKVPTFSQLSLLYNARNTAGLNLNLINVAYVSSTINESDPFSYKCLRFSDNGIQWANGNWENDGALVVRTIRSF